MIVCHCRVVSDRDIRRAVRRGAAGCAAVARECGASTDCGLCLRLVEEIIESEGTLGASPEAPGSLSDLAAAAR
jgi:bacterioferritin-associated ferredoxin